MTAIKRAIARYKITLNDEPVKLKPKLWTNDEDRMLLDAIEAN